MAGDVEEDERMHVTVLFLLPCIMDEIVLLREV